MHIISSVNDFITSLGLELIGVTETTPSLDLAPFLRQRAAQGFACRFEEKNIDCRTNPSYSLPHCQSIISMAMPYLPPEIPAFGTAFNSSPAAHEGIVARVALGQDYHEVFQQKAGEIVAFLQQILPNPFFYHVVTDRTPLIERELARRAGGIIGKHCGYISPQYGTWVILGEILLDIPLPTWKYHREVQSCLNCCRCRNACPTGALMAPYQINANRCISYITQSKEESSSKPVAAKTLKQRVYGCDICLEVCPLNEAALPSSLPEFSVPLLSPVINLNHILAMSKEEYIATINLTSASWIGQKRWRRNARILLGRTE